MAKIETKTTACKDDFAETCSDIMSGISSIFLFLLVTIFLLIIHNS